jgi:Tfp pilus assembly protein PilO
MKYKSKIYLITLIFFALAAIMFLFVYPSLHSRNARLAASVASQRQILEQLLQEQRSFAQGKKDIETLKTKPIQPGELFSADTRVVKEIKTLEDLSKTYGLDMNLQVSGTAKDAQKVKSSNQLLYVPYSLSVEGPFDKVLAFLDSAENLSFITPVKTMSISAQKEGIVKTTLTADFYLKK